MQKFSNIPYFRPCIRDTSILTTLRSVTVVEHEHTYEYRSGQRVVCVATYIKHVVARFMCLHAPRISTRHVTPIIALPLQISNVSAYKNITESEATQTDVARVLSATTRPVPQGLWREVTVCNKNCRPLVS
jgi:hypothetical protein